MSLLSNVSQHLSGKYSYAYYGTGIGIIGFFVANLIWKQGTNEFRFNTRKAYYYNRSVLLLHIKHQIKTYLPLILSNLITISAMFFYSSYNSYYKKNDMVSFNSPFILSKYKKIGVTYLLNACVITGISILFDKYNLFNDINSLELYDYYIESKVRNEIISNLSKQVLEVRNVLNKHCTNIDCEIGPQIREEILSYIGIPLYNHDTYKSSMKLHQYVSNDLKNKFIYDDQGYGENYSILSDWKTKAFFHLYCFAEIIALSYKGII